ncbi:hypothetical protein, conserved [Eimeria tenella]|uniref:Uncharacterized protein n=1 Tax=Eimeria tenella TaxID=5802 RepID=H9B9S2_EIMTE|nr:hypothetical protein, conserved [Eimeria tenella]AET50732.1 hypothetical protein [Eimeria tenella]CDJ41674.1 hypothetical protein, conserved [Eimeria tenella]|eukprot:XP_013232424.1 hypothetical protein, conserved [Eimeria tenella]
MNSHLLFALCLVTICVAEAAVGPQEPSVGVLPEASEVPVQEGAQLSQHDAPVPVPSGRRIAGPIMLLTLFAVLLSGFLATVDYRELLSSLKQKGAGAPEEPEVTGEPKAPTSGDPKAPEVREIYFPIVIPAGAVGSASTGSARCDVASSGGQQLSVGGGSPALHFCDRRMAPSWWRSFIALLY